MGKRTYTDDEMALNHPSWFDVCKPALGVLKNIRAAKFKPWSRAVTRVRAPKRGSFLSVVCWLEHYGFVKYSDGKWRATKKKYEMPVLNEGAVTDSGHRTAILQQVTNKYKTTVQDVLGDVRIGPAVTARDEFFHALHASGMTASHIATVYGQQAARVSNCIERHKARLMRQKVYGEA